MALSQRGFRHGLVLGGLLLAACGGHEPEDSLVVRAREWQARSDEAAREEQAAEEAHAAELQQAVLAIESDPPDMPSEVQFSRVLEYHCGDCHFPGPVASGGEQAFWLFFDDLQSMIRRSDVIPGDARGSRIIEYIRTRQDHVPPDIGIPPIPEIAITLIADFIDQLPAESDERASGR